MVLRNKKKLLLSLVITAIMALPSFTLAAETINIAVAANFTNTMEELISTYNGGTYGTVIKPVYDASGTFDAAIRNGNTPVYSLFFSADNIRPRDLVADGLAINDQAYAIGLLAAYSATPGLNMNATWFQGTSFTSGAVANPSLAPYGLAAQQYLTSIGLWPDARIKADYPNINEAFYAARDGIKQVGFVAYAQVIRIPVNQKSEFLPPESSYTPIVQNVCQITTSNVSTAAKTEAAAFYNWVLSDETNATLMSWGYAIP